MSDDQVHVPPIAMLPEPKPTEPPPQVNGNGEEQNVIEQAALMVHRAKTERESLQIQLTEAMLKNAAQQRELDAANLKCAELTNNLTAMIAQCDELRQEASDSRAVLSSFKAQLDHLEIPLPTRKRKQKP